MRRAGQRRHIMKTTAVRLHGENDLRLETFELPEVGPEEVLLKVGSDSLCASTYKAVKQGTAHKRVPPDIAEKPIIIGHEMAGEIVKVGSALTDKWKVGDRIVIQPALKLPSGYDPGYSYQYIGGSATYAVVPSIVLERGCMIKYRGENFYGGSLVESLGCIIRGFKGFYHTDYETYTRTDGAKKGGKLAILAGAGPMGLGAVELAKGYAGCGQVVVTDINAERLAWAAAHCTVEEAKAAGMDLRYIDTSGMEDPVAELKAISDGGFDDVFVMAPVPALFTMAEQICREDGCVNFFAGPAIHDMQGSLNLYRIHYDGIHVVGTAGSIPEDTVDILNLIDEHRINPGVLVSHILGLKAVPEGIFGMARPSGAKKVCYPSVDIPMVAVSDFAELGKTDPLYRKLDELCSAHGGMWCTEAEEYLLANGPKLPEA